MSEDDKSFKIQIPPKVEKELDHLPDKIAENVLNQIKNLSGDPFPNNFKKLKGRDGYRIRV